MNARERVLIAAAGGKPDKVPAGPYIGNYGAALAGVPISRYNTSGKRMAEAHAKAWELHQLDFVVPQSDNYYIAEAFGVRIFQPENDTPYVVEHAIKSLDEVDSLPLTIDPVSDGRMYVYLEAVSRLKEIFGKSVAIRSGGTGMFSLAAHVLGYETFLTELAMADMTGDPVALEKIHALMNRMTDALITFASAVLEAGCDFAVCGDSSASPDLISPAYYEKFVFPFEKRFFDTINPICARYGATSLLHICGNTTKILPHMAATGAHILEIDHKVNLKTARELVGDKICLMGNLDPVRILLNGTPEIVHQASQQAIADAGLNGAFILGSGCEVAVHTPLENILALREAAHGHRYA